MTDSAPGKAQRLLTHLWTPVDGAWLAAFRILFGGLMTVSVLRFIAYGWIDEFFVNPTFHFKYWGFSFVEPLGGAGMHALFWVLFGLALAMTVGFCFRFAAAAFFIGFSYVQLIDVATYLNHYYLASLLTGLLALSPAGRVYSVDAWLTRRNRLTEVPRFWLYLLRFQVAVVYSFAGLAKGQSDWLVHGQPLGIWLGGQTGMPLLGALFAEPWAASAMSWAGFLFDSSVVWFLLFGRTRLGAYLVVIVFHTLTSLLFPIGMFPFIMVLSALVFFPPDWPRRALAHVKRLFGRPGAQRSGITEPASRRPSVLPRYAVAITAVSLAYCVVHVAVPLRFLAYGGNVLWHEQGMRFSWRVMVREKNGSVTYLVRQKETGRVWHVPPRDYVNRVQEREMSSQPDMILQLAKHVGRDFEARGHGPVEVRVDALASLNGRRLAPLIDPAVDLLQVQDGIARASYITKSPEAPPPRLRPLPAEGYRPLRTSAR